METNHFFRPAGLCRNPANWNGRCVGAKDDMCRTDSIEILKNLEFQVLTLNTSLDAINPDFFNGPFLWTAEQDLLQYRQRNYNYGQR